MKNKVIDYISGKHTYFIIGSLLLLFPPNFINFLSINFLPGLIYRGIILIIFSILSLFSFFCNKQYKDKIFCIFISLYLFFSIFSLCLNEAKTVLNIEIIDFFMSLGEIVSTIISVIFIRSCLKSCKTNKSLIVKILAFISTGLIILSLIIDREAILNTFTRFDHSNYDVKSIFFDKNTFGLFLFAGCISFCYLGLIKNRLYLIGAFINTIYCIIARTKTSLLISLILLFCSFIYCAICDTKTKKFGNTIVYFIAIFLILILLIFTIFKIGFFEKIFNIIFEDYGLIYDGKVVFCDRFTNWKNKLAQINSPLIWIFGYGERLAYAFAGRPIDNSYLYILLNGGLVKLVLYFVFVVYILWFKVNKSQLCLYKICEVFSISSILLYGIFEDCYMIGCSLSSLIFSLIVICI